VVFKRRTKQTFGKRLIASVYPRGGYLRAIWYVMHRLRRLPDQPHRIARGIAAGVLVSFSPFFGFHFVIAVGLAWLIGGNMVAALLATFVGNPITFPFIMTLSVELGSHILGERGGIPLRQIVDSFARASVELWDNFTALFLDHSAHWGSLILFFHHVFWPYFIGGLIPGLISALIGYYLSLPLITAYQKRRKKKIKERIEKLREHRARAAAEAAKKAQTQPSE
jgi:hypothetical protein